MSTLSTPLRSTSTPRAVYCSTRGASFVESVDARATPAADVPPCKIMRAEIKYLSHLLKELEVVQLMKGSEDEPAATVEAYLAAREILIHAAITAGLEGRAIPKGFVTTDPEGGVRIEWFRTDARVHLVIRAARERGGYIYHRSAAGYGTVPATAYSLAKWLKFISE